MRSSARPLPVRPSPPTQHVRRCHPAAPDLTANRITVLDLGRNVQQHGLHIGHVDAPQVDIGRGHVQGALIVHPGPVQCLGQGNHHSASSISGFTCGQEATRRQRSRAGSTTIAAINCEIE